MTRKYAQGTHVPANQTRNEIETMLTKHGATGFVYGSTIEQAMIAFEMSGWRLKFMLPFPLQKRMTDAQYAAEVRRRWRALLLVLKAKLEAVASGIVVFEREFLPFIVTNGAATVGDQVLPGLPQLVSSGKMPPLLGPPGGES